MYTFEAVFFHYNHLGHDKNRVTIIIPGATFVCLYQGVMMAIARATVTSDDLGMVIARLEAMQKEEKIIGFSYKKFRGGE